MRQISERKKKIVKCKGFLGKDDIPSNGFDFSYLFFSANSFWQLKVEDWQIFEFLIPLCLKGRIFVKICLRMKYIPNSTDFRQDLIASARTKLEGLWTMPHRAKIQLAVINDCLIYLMIRFKFNSSRVAHYLSRTSGRLWNYSCKSRKRGR